MSATARRRPVVRRAAAVAAGLVLALGGVACGGGDGSAAPPERSATEHNEADVAFASDMVQHHAQALSMVDLTRGRPLDPEVQALAERIRDAQAPEIEQMTDWLLDWGEEVPPTVRDHVHAGHGDGSAGSPEGSHEELDHGDMPGMMTAEDLGALEDASDADFQALWLELMVEHHSGAVEMAEAEVAEGRYQPAVDLAEDIARSQAAEVEEMQALLG